MQLKNAEIAKIFREMGGYYEIKNVPFKPRAYELAADSIESLDEQVQDIYEAEGFGGLKNIPRVGQGIAEHIEELIRTGRLQKYEGLRKQIPVNLAELTNVEGVGAKTAGILYKRLGVRSLGDLKKAIAGHRLQKIKGFGRKSEENLSKALGTASGFEKRFLLGQIYPVVEKLRNTLETSGLFTKVMVGGSYRRRQETVGDIDILATAPVAKTAMNFFVKYRDTARVVESGETKSVIKLSDGIQVDLRIVPGVSWGAAAQYFTGDLAHNIKMRKIAIAKGWKLSEYGVFRGKKMIAGRTEEEVYKKLGLKQLPPPELRTDSGEIEAAIAGKLPKLINYGDVRGDLQTQTSWTDGNNSIEQMAQAALARGREYIAITDHTKSLVVAGGLDEKKLLKQGKEIDKLNFKFQNSNSKFKILKGAEVNILKDGSLDTDDKTLAELDVVGVSVHSHFKLSREDQTRRIIKAISNPLVDILFHPTTRIIQKRAPIDFDFSAVLKAARKFRTALEINAHPWRLDLHDKLIRQAIDAGVKLVIDTDAHVARELDYIHFGEAQARRGWAKKSDVLNTKRVEELLKYFAKKSPSSRGGG